MKKILLLLSVIAFCNITSCKKDGIQECASCTESNSGYTAPDYCGDPIAVDKYIDELKSQGAASGQHWSCTTH